MTSRRIILLVGALTLLNACSSSSDEVTFRYWILDVASPESDFVLTIDGDTHTLPVAIEFPEAKANWGTTRITKSKVKGALDGISFEVESRDGHPISWTSDLLYDLTPEELVGLKYTAFYLERDKAYVRDRLSNPQASSLLANVKNFQIPLVQRSSDGDR